MNYTFLFATHKQLLKQNIPDDLIPIFFEYLGDLNETIEDLTNKHCWYKITYEESESVRNYENKKIKFWSRKRGGHYCTVCNKVYDIYSTWEFKQHCRGNVHKRNLKKGQNFDPPTKTQIVDAMKKKYTEFWLLWAKSQSKNRPKREIRTLLAEKINPFK